MSDAAAGRRRRLGAGAPGRGGSAARRRAAGRTRTSAATCPARSRSCSARRRRSPTARRSRSSRPRSGCGCGRHGVTGEERLVLYDGGDCVGAAASAQLAELAGHPAVAVLAGGFAAVAGRARDGRGGAGEDEASSSRSFEAVPTWRGAARAARRPGADDPRRPHARTSSRASAGYPCDPRQGHIPGARHLEPSGSSPAPGQPLPPEEIRALVGPARGRRDRRVLPLGLALGARRARAPLGRLPRAQLPGLVARVVAPRRAARRALSGASGRRPRSSKRTQCSLGLGLGP